MSVTYRAPDSLRPHPLNGRVYDADRDAEELRASVAAHGILAPLTIDQDGTILSGHRRWQAARAVGLDRVPVIVRAVADPLEAEHVLIESNRQREKTYSERMREADHLTRIGGAQNQARLRAGKADPRPSSDEGNASHQRTDSQVAEALGLKRDTYRKVRRVYEAAHDATGPETICTVARQQLAALDAGEVTPNGADKTLREAETRHEVQELMDTLATEGVLDPPGSQTAWERLDAPIPGLPESDLLIVGAFSANMAVRAHAAKAHLVSAYMKRVGTGGLAGAAVAFGISRPTAGGLLILHEEAQGGVRFRPTGLEFDEGMPYHRWLDVCQTIGALAEVSTDSEDEQLLDRCRGLIRQMVRQSASAARGVGEE